MAKDFNAIKKSSDVVLSGIIQKVDNKKNFLIILTDDGKIEKLYIKEDIIVFYSKKKSISSFSWNIIHPGTSIEAIGYYNNKSLLVVYYIQIDRLPDIDDKSFSKSLKKYKGSISSIDYINSIVEIDSSGNKIYFNITQDTIIFDWNIGKKIIINDISKGQEVYVESIPSLNNQEAVILEIGDADLYY